MYFMRMDLVVMYTMIWRKKKIEAEKAKKIETQQNL